MVAEVKIEGMRKLQRAMRKLPGNLQKKHLRRALRQGGALMRDAIKANAPVGETGRLSKKVRVKARRGKRTYIKTSIIYPTPGTRDDKNNAYYWRFVERGTKHQSANPFIRRAADSNFNKVVNHVVRETRRGVDEDIRALRRGR